MKLNGYPNRTEYGRKCFWTIRLSHLIEPKLILLDPAEITRAFQQIWQDAVSNPGRAWTNYTNFVAQYTDLMTSATLKYWGMDKGSQPTVAAEKGDKRFSATDWQQNPVFDAL